MVIAEKVSEIAAIKEVRIFAVAHQQKMGVNIAIVIDGWDIGTTFLQDAKLKIFMTADIAVRVERRYIDMFEKNPDVSIDDVKANLEMRDFIDSNREISPFRKAENAIELDNTEVS